MIRVPLRNFFVLFVICILVGLFYGGTLQNGFIHDDHGQVEHNTYIQSLMYLPKVFTSCIWESAVGNCKDTYYWRPLQSLSYMITYQFSSYPWIFHLVNLVYFALDVWLTYILIRLLTGDRWLAMLTAGIFLFHPLNTEVVNWIATVPELLFVFFVLLSTIFFILYRRTGLTKYLRWLTVTFILGILAKEPAVFLPFVFLTLDLVYFNKKMIDVLKWKNVQPYVFAVIFFLVYLWARLSVLGGLGADPYYRLTLPQRIYIFIDLFGAYMRKLVFPYPFNLFYTFHPTYTILRPDFIIAVGILTAFIGLWVLAVKKKWKIVSFAFIWYLAFLAPSLIFINSIGENLFAERHVFASTIGFAVLIAIVLRRLGRLGMLGRIGVIGVIGSFAALSFFVIYARNQIWRSDEVIYADTLKKSPDADLIRYNLAYLYEQSGKTSTARDEYGIIVKRNSWRGLAKVFNNLGNMTRKGGDYALASRYFQQSLATDPLHVEAYNNLGAMSLEQGDLLTSLTYLCRANEINPSFQDANNNFDKLVGMIQGMDEKTFGTLYRELLAGGTFRPADQGNQMTLHNKDCASTACLFIFSAPVPQQIFIFSFLIGGQTESGQIVRPRRFGIRQQTGDIILDLDKKWESETIRFSFPTCDKTYYQVTAQAH